VVNPSPTAFLQGHCPDTVVVQTDWLPEAELGFIYQLMGPGYTIDSTKASVTGPLIDAKGLDTGVKLQIRSAGAALSFDSVSDIMYNDGDILLGDVYTDEAIQFSATKPTIAIESGMVKSPQMVMWDPARYPAVNTIADLGTQKIKVRTFADAPPMNYLTSAGLLSADQLDSTYDGSSTAFVGDGGLEAQQGFGTIDPYQYENRIDGWKKPVKYQYLDDVGWTSYGASIVTKPENIDKYRACFQSLVPLIQQASVDFMHDPSRADAIILDAVSKFGGTFGWVYDQPTADAAVATMHADGIVANGPDGTLGGFDTTRVTTFIATATPVLTAMGQPPKVGLAAADLVTNEFVDASIHL